MARLCRRPMYLTLKHLLYFSTVVEAGSITRAATRLHVTPTALSLQIKAIEDQFGAPLLSRHSRGVQPTVAGARLAEKARGILESVAEAERELAPPPPPSSLTIRLGVQPAIARLIGYEATVGIGKRIPGALLSTMEGWSADLERRLDAGELDVLVGYGLSAAEGRLVTDLLDDRLFHVTSTGTSTGRGPISLAEALGTPLVFYGERSLSWRVATGAAGEAGLEIPRHIHVRSVELWRSLLRHGTAAGLATYGAIRDEHRRGEVVVREIADHALTATIRVSVRTDLAHEAWVGRFQAFVLDLMRALDLPGRARGEDRARLAGTSG